MTPVRANRCVVKARSWMAPHPATGNPVQVVSGMDYWDLLRRYEALIAERNEEKRDAVS